MTDQAAIPARIGPVEFGELGGMIAVRCPHDFDHLMRRAGGLCEPGSRRWLIERRRIGPVLRELRRDTNRCFGGRPGKLGLWVRVPAGWVSLSGSVGSED